MTRRTNAIRAWRLEAMACACALLLGCAQQPSTPSPPPAAAAAPSAASPSRSASDATTATASADLPRAAIDPGVLQALDRTGEALRRLKNFELQVAMTTDELLDNDQMAQVGRSATLQVRRPDGLRADMRNDRGDHKVLYYDGRKASLWDPASRYYTMVDAPPTLAALVRVLADRYGIDLPAADLFEWDSSRLDERGVRSADYLGEADIDGTRTGHYAIREEGMDWQIWIERGALALPRKLVITTTDVAGRPQHSVLMRWKLSPKFGSTNFEFIPPTGARRIAIQTLGDGATSAPTGAP